MGEGKRSEGTNLAPQPTTLLTVDNQGDVSKPVLLSLFIQSVEIGLRRVQELLKAFHRLFSASMAVQRSTKEEHDNVHP